jgi:predicted transcriptional regulator of viral defense system
MKLVNKYLLKKFGGKIISKDELKAVGEKFGVRDIDKWLNYLQFKGYVIRIFRGVYYVKTLEEFLSNSQPSVYELIAMVMEKGTLGWYFGLFTALRFNGVTHEYFTKIFVISDTVKKTKPIKIAGETVEFIKIKPALTKFGIKQQGVIKYSNLEKTLLDFIYLANYRSISKELALKTFKEYLPRADKRVLKRYVKDYPRSVLKVVEAYEP